MRKLNAIVCPHVSQCSGNNVFAIYAQLFVFFFFLIPFRFIVGVQNGASGEYLVEQL